MRPKMSPVLPTYSVADAFYRTYKAAIGLCQRESQGKSKKKAFPDFYLAAPRNTWTYTAQRRGRQEERHT